MKTSRSFSAGRVLVLLLLLFPHAGFAQTSRGSTGAIVLLGKISSSIAAANTIEYTSTIHTNDVTGQQVTLYVHAKLCKPTSVHVTVSTTQLDAPDAILIVADSQEITGFNPSLNMVTHHPMDSSGPNLALPPGFVTIEPAFPTVRQMFATAPFDTLFYGDVHSPITLVRQGIDIPGTQMIDAQWPTELIGESRLAKLYVDMAAPTPRRLLLGSIENGSASVQYIEDFTSFTLNPTLTNDTFRWTPPASPRPSKPPSAKTAKPSAKKPAVKHPHKPAKRRHTS